MSSTRSDLAQVADGSSQADAARAVRSPCIQVCTLDSHGICVGCGRHIDEIAAWRQLTLEQQRSICEQAARRLAANPAYGKR